MAENLKRTALPRALSDVVGDLADLLQMEIRLARAELSAKFSAKLRAGVWASAAAGFGIGAAFLILQAMVFAIASFGIALHWSCLIIAAGLALLGIAAFVKGRADLAEDVIPTRTIHQVQQDIATAKEQLS